MLVVVHYFLKIERTFQKDNFYFTLSIVEYNSSSFSFRKNIYMLYTLSPFYVYMKLSVALSKMHYCLHLSLEILPGETGGLYARVCVLRAKRETGRHTTQHTRRACGKVR